MLEEDGGHFAGGILLYVFRDEKFCSNFVGHGLIEIEWALAQVMPWCRWGGKPDTCVDIE